MKKGIFEERIRNEYLRFNEILNKILGFLNRLINRELSFLQRRKLNDAIKDLFWRQKEIDVISSGFHFWFSTKHKEMIWNGEHITEEIWFEMEQHVLRTKFCIHFLPTLSLSLCISYLYLFVFHYRSCFSRLFSLIMNSGFRQNIKTFVSTYFLFRLLFLYKFWSSGYSPLIMCEIWLECSDFKAPWDFVTICCYGYHTERFKEKDNEPGNIEPLLL